MRTRSSARTRGLLPIVAAVLAACGNSSDVQSAMGPTQTGASAGTTATNPPPSGAMTTTPPAAAAGTGGAAGTVPAGSGGSAPPIVTSGTGGDSGAAGMSTAAAGSASTEGSGDSAPTPSTMFNCDDLSELNMDVFPTEDEMWASMTKMVDEMGPRHAGSDGDHKWTDYIEQRMKDMGLQNIKRMDTQVLGTNGLSGQGQPTSGTSTHMSGVLPGMSEDIIVIGEHKDGPNSVEENGTVISLEVMDYISKIPKECRKHTFALAFPTCHMASCAQADVGAWNSMNPEIVQHAIAFLAPEHAGHKRRAPDSTTIQQAFLCTTPGMKAQCEAVLADIRMETGESADQWFITTEALGSSAAWSASTGKPTIGSMSYWDTLAAGLTDTTVKLEGIDKRTFYEVTKFYGRMAGWIDGHADAL